MDIEQLKYLTTSGLHLLDKAAEGSEYLPKTVRGVATFLLDNEGDIDLLTSKQRATYDRFIKPLMDVKKRS